MVTLCEFGDEVIVRQILLYIIVGAIVFLSRVSCVYS